MLSAGFCVRATQPAACCAAFGAASSAAPAAMMSAITGRPSRVSCAGVSELIVRLVVLLGRCQPGDTTYQIDRPAASRCGGKPSVRHGSQPVGCAQLGAARPSFAEPTSPQACGQGSRPGFTSVGSSALVATHAINAAL